MPPQLTLPPSEPWQCAQRSVAFKPSRAGRYSGPQAPPGPSLPHGAQAPAVVMRLLLGHQRPSDHAPKATNTSCLLLFCLRWDGSKRASKSRKEFGNRLQACVPFISVHHVEASGKEPACQRRSHMG